MPKSSEVSDQGRVATLGVTVVQLGQSTQTTARTYASKSCLPGHGMEMSWSPVCQEHVGHILLYGHMQRKDASATD